MSPPFPICKKAGPVEYVTVHNFDFISQFRSQYAVLSTARRLAKLDCCSNLLELQPIGFSLPFTPYLSKCLDSFFMFALFEQLITLPYATAFISSYFIYKSSIFAFLARQFNIIYLKTTRPDYEEELPLPISLLICLHSKLLVSEARHVEPTSIEVVIYIQNLFWECIVFSKSWSSVVSPEFNCVLLYKRQNLRLYYWDY